MPEADPESEHQVRYRNRRAFALAEFRFTVPEGGSWDVAQADRMARTAWGQIARIDSIHHHLLRRYPIGCFERFHAFKFLTVRSERNSIEEHGLSGNEQNVRANTASPITGATRSCGDGMTATRHDHYAGSDTRNDFIAYPQVVGQRSVRALV